MTRIPHLNAPIPWTGGGPATIRQFLHADLIDHMRIVLVPIVLGCGEPARDGLEG